jgi:phosphate transport system permease protein
MSASTVQDQRPPTRGTAVERARLPRWTPIAIAVAAILVAIGIGAGAGLRSHIQWGLIALLLFVAGSYVVTAIGDGKRQAKDRVATSLVYACFILAIIPLYSLIETTIAKGVKVLDGYFLTHSMSGVITTGPGGGVYAAIIGTIEQVGITTVISVPLGIFTAIYLVEYGRGRLARAITFFVDVMTGIPSIVAGLFILSLVLIMGFTSFYSGFVGSLALVILMLPIVVRSSEEMLKLVPNELREATYALGVPKWRTILSIVLPTSIGGIITGVVLAIARVAGETAPVLLLIFGNSSINNNPFKGSQDSLPLFIYEEYNLGNDDSFNRAWSAALVLIIFVMILNLIARGLARWKAPKGAGR